MLRGRVIGVLEEGLRTTTRSPHIRRAIRVGQGRDRPSSHVCVGMQRRLLAGPEIYTKPFLTVTHHLRRPSWHQEILRRLL
jgi:hypothetical protein